MDKTKALQKLLNGTATKKEIEMLKQALASGEISIGGDVNRSVVIIGSGNKVELTAEALGILKPEATSEEIVEGKPPYMGLRYFDISDAGIFFGREALTQKLVARVMKEPFLAIIGASGSGKSSVARAGLIPSWTKENEGRGMVYVITPTAHPLESLAVSFTRASESVTATSTLMDDMQRNARSLRLYIKKILADLDKPNALLLVDQFEETFTLCKDNDERKAFIGNLLSLTEEDGAVRVVLTLRADFYHHCAEYVDLRFALEKYQAYIGAMTPDELREAITLPAQKNSWDFQPGLVDLILSDIGKEPGALPLLSHALLETWKRRQACTLTLKGYADAGGVKKAIAQTAENVYERLTPAEQTIVRGIFLRLTELGEDVQDTRRRANLSELSISKDREVVAKVLKTLTDARLVITEHDSVEVAHEALIREWKTLRYWLDEDRDKLRLYRHLTDSTQEWERASRNDMYVVHRGTRLDDIIKLIKDEEYTLSPNENDYIDACMSLREKEEIEKQAQSSMKRENSRLRVESGITQVVGTSLNIEGVIDSILGTLHDYESFSQTQICVLLYNDRDKMLHFAPATFKYYEIKNPVFLQQNTLSIEANLVACRVAKRTLETKTIEWENIRNIEKDIDSLFLNPNFKSECCVSLINIDHDLLGVLSLESDRLSGFDESDLELIKTVARHLSIAIERANQSEVLRTKSAIAAQTSWAANFAHEINNEVQKIVNWAYVIQKESTKNPLILEYAKNIEKSAYDLAGTNPWAMRTIKIVEIDSLIIEYLEKLAPKRDVRTYFEMNAKNIHVKVSSSQFGFIMKQLVNNASRAMQDYKEKKILVSTREIENRIVEIQFQDFGPGISDEIRPWIFNWQFTTKETGGVGLLFVRQMIEDMNGGIFLMPYEVGKGAVFCIHLPIANPE